MEENKKLKKFKIIKWIGLILILAYTTILSIGACNSYYNASEIPVNYLTYQAVVKIESVYLINGVYEGHCEIMFKIEDNNLINYNDSMYPDFYCDEADLLSGPYETYGATELKRRKWYLIQYSNNQNLNEITQFTIIKASEINTFYQYWINENYNLGYSAGANDTEQEIYENGYNNGLQQATQNYLRGLNEQKAQYEATIQAQQQQINELTDTINSGRTPWGSFKSLLGTIFLFPIRFFKEGLNVEIFGVNVGGLMLGIGMIGIILAILGIILGRRKA